MGELLHPSVGQTNQRNKHERAKHLRVRQPPRRDQRRLARREEPVRHELKIARVPVDDAVAFRIRRQVADEVLDVCRGGLSRGLDECRVADPPDVRRRGAGWCSQSARV